MKIPIKLLGFKGILYLWYFYLLFMPLYNYALERPENSFENFKRESLRLPDSQLLLQQVTVAGLVTDSLGQAIPGVSISVKGNEKVSTSTDEKGMYVIRITNSSSILLFSNVGYHTQEVPVGGRREINVIMQASDAEIEQVVVVAFGSQRKKETVGSMSTINPSELKVPSSNLTTALAGRVAGLVAYQRSGEPGQDNADFFIRGVTTFGYASSPLILIDGVEMRSEDLARLQPDDIASFSIMKDASATALYGARGANGVILVSTKEGKEGKASVSVRYERSLSGATQNIELADPISYMRLHNESILTRDPLGIMMYSQEKIENTEKGSNSLMYPVTDWQSTLFKDYTVNDRLNFNVSGGGKVARYYIAATYNKDNGMLNVDERNNFNSNIDLKKYLLRSNININVTNSTEAIIRLHGTFDDYTGPLESATSLYNKVVRSNPVLFPAYYPVDDAHENVTHILFGNSGTGEYINPYADLMRGYKDYSKSLMMAQFELKQDLSFITPGLKARGLFSTNRYAYFDVQRFYKPFYYKVGMYDKINDSYSIVGINPESGQEHLDYAEGAKEISTNSYMEAALNYDKKLGEKHALSGLLVFVMRNSLIGNAGTLQKSLAYRNLGLSGRATYSFLDRYFLEGNFGYNGSERFDKNNRFGFFPSIGAAWDVSGEPFWSDGIRRVISMFKLKATYGLVGNDAIGSAEDRFYYLSQMNMNNSTRGYTFGSDFQYTKNGISISRYENSNITWETAYKSNFGVELKIANVLTLNADIYKENRKNILLTRSHIPATMGLQVTPRANLGEMKSSGLDASLDFSKSFNSGIWLSARANFTYAVSEMVAVSEPDYGDTPWRSTVGYSYGQRWGYVAERLFVDDNEVKNSPYQGPEVMAGDIKYKDINNDGQINEIDRVPIGFPTVPQVVYGFGVSVGWKGADFSCFFQGLGRESFWIDSKATAPFIGINGNALLKAYQDSHWSEANRDLYALWPRLSFKENENNNAVSTWFMRDGSFLRLKSVEAGYTFPQNWTSKFGVQKARLYASGVNLLTFSQFKLWDPEMAGNGLGYPVQRVGNIGLQISF
ncbi:SusC/RagA family TonB-linked outer membrane protein [Sphingobacterium humi]|nr:TonB-dependent receptor [Sphingobacterium humi]